MAGRLSLKGLFAVVVWGASFVATRVALDALTPFGLVAIRTCTGALLLGALLCAGGHRLLPMARDRPLCALLGMVVGAHLLVQAFGLQYTSAIHTGWIIGFIPVTVALGAHWLGQQRLRPLGWLGVMVGTAGVFVVTLDKLPDFAHARWGDLLQITSCLTWTVYTLAAAGPLARSGALRVTTASMAVAALLTLLVALKTGFVRGPWTLPVVLALVFLGFVCSGVAYFAWFAATHEHGPTRVGALLYVEPFVTLITAAILLDERVGPSAIAGGLGVLLGVWLVHQGAPDRLAPATTPEAA